MENFWTQLYLDGLRPTPIETPEELPAARSLAIACTQTGRTPHQQRKLVRSWCELLPTLEGIDYLWFQSRVPQDLFDAACAVPGLKALWVKWSGIKSVAAIEQAENLECFYLGASTGLSSIEPLGNKTRLQWLGLENVKRITSLEPLVPLQNLVGLEVDGSMWTTQRVETLTPIGKLAGLRYLSITNLRANDKTLQPLYPLSKLETFRAAMWWPEEEVAEIRRRNPNLTHCDL